MFCGIAATFLINNCPGRTPEKINIMKKSIIAAAAASCFLAGACCQTESMEELTERVFARASEQLALLDSNLDEAGFSEELALCPRYVDHEGNLVTSNIWWWCSGFYPGSLWLVYEYTGDEGVKALAEKHTEVLDSIRFRTNDHDVGFQLDCSYGNGYRLTGNPEYKAVLCDGAHSLATRFNPAVGCTRSWDPAPDHIAAWKFPVIIDNMMNMELLLSASELCGDESLRAVAESHAMTVMKNHFREDGSSFHLVDYDPVSGEVLVRQTVQGFADWSSWARGQAWGLYGFTMMYQYTGGRQYLDHAVKIAEYLIPRLPEDGIPYWDFDSDLIPDDLRDASAGAIMASALVQLSGFVRDEAGRAEKYLSVAERILRTLASDEYLAAPGEDCGFILKHSVGNKPGGVEVDVPLTYSDYYFLEALLRYRALSSSPRSER